LVSKTPYDGPSEQRLLAKFDNFGGAAIETEYAPSQSLKFSTFSYKTSEALSEPSTNSIKKDRCIFIWIAIPASASG